MMAGTIEVLACSCSRMENFLDSGLGLQGRRTPWGQWILYLHRQINQQWHFHRLALWSSSPVSRDQVRSAGCRGMTGIGSASQTFHLSPRPFFPCSFSASFPPAWLPSASSRPRCSTSPQVPSFLPLDWLPLPPATHMPLSNLLSPSPHRGLPFRHLLRLGLSLCLSPPTERRSLRPDSASLGFHSHHRQPGNSSSEVGWPWGAF